jgi:hypothetical protein
MAKHTTPRTVDDVRDFLVRVPGESPRFIPVRAEPWALENHCDSNCLAKVQREGGGRVVPGWAIWLMPGHFIEAEYHCVYEDSGGSLVDITPKTDGETRILFVPNPSAGVGERTPENITEPLSSLGRRLAEESHKKHLQLMELWDRVRPSQQRKDAEILADALAYKNPMQRAAERRRKHKKG